MDNEEKPKSSLVIVVMADKLFNAIEKGMPPEKLEALIDECTALDNPNGLGSTFREPNKNQTTDVYKGDRMEWSISTLYEEDEKIHQEYKVELKSVKQDIKPGTTGFFTKNPLYPEDGIIEGIVTGIRVSDGQEESYTIYFSITKDKETKGPLPIDPRLKINQ